MTASQQPTFHLGASQLKLVCNLVIIGFDKSLLKLYSQLSNMDTNSYISHIRRLANQFINTTSHRRKLNLR